jgi:hypothetical protein
MNWYKLFVSDEDATDGKHFSFQTDFDKVFIASKQADGFCLYISKVKGGNNFFVAVPNGCDLFAYPFIKLYSFIPCVEPTESLKAYWGSDARAFK